MFDEDRGSRVRGPSERLPQEHVEHPRLHHRDDRVREAPFSHCMHSLVKWRGHTRAHNMINQSWSYTFNHNACVLESNVNRPTNVSFLARLVSSILAVLQIEGFDVKALRAFRVLRPLRLISGVPSKNSFTWSQIWLKCVLRQISVGFVVAYSFVAQVCKL